MDLKDYIGLGFESSNQINNGFECLFVM